MRRVRAGEICELDCMLLKSEGLPSAHGLQGIAMSALAEAIEMGLLKTIVPGQGFAAMALTGFTDGARMTPNVT
jgi:hypothetical protein